MATREIRVSLSSSSDDNEGEEEESNQHQQQPEIPHDLLTYQILIRLPIKTLLRFKSVSKLWYSTLSSLQFANAHFKSSPFSLSSSPSQCLFIKSGLRFYLFCYDDDDNDMVSYYGGEGFVELNPNFYEFHDDLHLVGSCRGLVCLATSSGFFIIWNPITGQFRQIPDFAQFNLAEFRNVSCGFGYTSSVDDYKIVRIIEMPCFWEVKIHVFSFKSNTWRKIDHTPYEHLLSFVKTPYSTSIFDIFFRSFETRWAVLVDENLYWVVANTRIPSRKIVTFSLALEKFDELPHLKLRSTELYRDDFLFVMGGCLSKCGVTWSGDKYVTVCRHPRVKKSVRLFKNMRLESCHDFVGFTKTGKFFVIDRSLRKLGLVDPCFKPVRYTPLLKFGSEHGIAMLNYVPSLISPYTIMELP